MDDTNETQTFLALRLPRSPSWVLTGIGHERDSTVLDEVANAKFDTPSKVIAGTRAKAWAYSAVKKGELIEAGMRDGSKLYQLVPVKDEGTEQSVQAAEPVVAAEVAPVAEVVSTT